MFAAIGTRRAAPRGSDGVCLACTLSRDLWGKSLTERSYRKDGKLSCPCAGPPSKTLLGGCRSCLMVHLFRSKHALQLNPGLFVRHRAAVASLVAFCLSLRCAVVADTLSLRAGGVASLLGQACVLGQTHASVDAPHSLTHSAAVYCLQSYRSY